MSVIATAVAALIEAGVSGDALVAAIARMEAAQLADRQPVRTARQERNARYYENRKARLKTSELSESVLIKTVQTLSDGAPPPAPSLDGRPPLPTPTPPTLYPSPTPVPPPASDEAGAPKGAETGDAAPVVVVAEEKPAKRKRRLPADFEPGDRSRKTLADLNRPASWGWEAFAEMKDWADGGGETKIDWDATLAGWMRRKAQNEHGRGGGLSARAGPGNRRSANGYHELLREELGGDDGITGTHHRPFLAVAGSRH